MTLLGKGISRRSFLKGGVAAAGAASLFGVSGCASSGESAQGDAGGMQPHVVQSDVSILEGSGAWMPLTCNENCNGFCRNHAYVVDGVIVRQKGDDAHEDTDELPQSRPCPKGRARRQEMYNVDRLKYPMKRKSWQPGGGENSNGQLRGRDDWERISWDEALDYIADELTRIYDAYGPRAVVNNSWRWLPVAQLLKAAGGCILNADTESYGTWGYKPELIGVDVDTVWAQPDMWVGNDRTDLHNADYIVLYGGNAVWNQSVTSSFYLKQAQESGTKFVFVGPGRNVTADMLDARWIPVRPATDTAFMLAVIYEMLRLDEEEGGVIDWDFLNSYTVGFDADHLPDDARLDECISGYVKGDYDGVPKTPEWASAICGTPTEDITDFARICGKNNNVMLLHNYGMSRAAGSENFPQAFITVGTMGGHMGRSGNCVAANYSYDCGDMGSFLYRSNPDKVRANPSIDNPLGEHAHIEGPSLWKSCLDGKYVSTAPMSHQDDADLHVYYTKAQECEVLAKAFVSVNNNYLQSRQDLNDGIKAMRQAELVVAADFKPTLTVQFADIVLPIATDLEGRVGGEDVEVWPNAGINGSIVGKRDTILAQYPIVEPLYEARNDEWALKEIAVRMGLDADALFPYTNRERFFDAYLSLEYLEEDGETWSNAFSLTQQEADGFGIDNPPQEGAMPFSEFISGGMFQIPRREGDRRGHIGYADYIADPVANPRPSRSGRFELYSQLKADNLNAPGLNPEPVKPYANYIRPVEGYEETFSDWEGKAKGDYPLQAYNIHYMRRAHTCFDNSPWLQEAFVNPVFLNIDDAAARGISDGDTVLVRSKWGKTLRHATLLSSMMPGVLAIPHGAHSVLDETDPDDIIDRGGNEQILYGPTQSNYYKQLDIYNSLLVEVERYDGEPLVEDYERDPFLLGSAQ